MILGIIGLASTLYNNFLPFLCVTFLSVVKRVGLHKATTVWRVAELILVMPL